MESVEAVLEVVKNKILEKLGGEVDLVFQYGSFVRGNTHPYSDIDISYVPVHDDTWACITVLVDGRLCDCYPMHWPTLEKMADFRNPSASVLFENRVLFQRTDEAGARFQALAEQLKAQLLPGARGAMIARAQEIFQATAYPYFLLRQEAAAGSAAGCMQQSLAVFRAVLHCLAVANQQCADTRKLEQVLALPRLPEGFSENARRLTTSTCPAELLEATGSLLESTRALLLEEQRLNPRPASTLAREFDSAYPEFKRDIQQVLLGCQRRDLFTLRGSVVALYHELSRGIARADEGFECTRFHTLSDYEQDFAAMGFPALLPALAAEDYDRLARQVTAFDERLRAYLAEREVALNDFATLEALKAHFNQG